MFTLKKETTATMGKNRKVRNYRKVRIHKGEKLKLEGVPQGAISVSKSHVRECERAIALGILFGPAHKYDPLVPTPTPTPSNKNG